MNPDPRTWVREICPGPIETVAAPHHRRTCPIPGIGTVCTRAQFGVRKDLRKTDMNRFALTHAALHPVARFLSATAIVALSAAAGVAQTSDDAPRGASTIWVVQPKVTLGGETIAAGQTIALKVGPATDDAQDTTRTAQAATTSDAAPAESPDAKADAAAPEANASEGASDSAASADATAAETSADAPEDASSETPPDGETSETSGEAAQGDPAPDVSAGGAGSSDTEASEAESAVDPDDDAGNEEVAPEESAILPSAEDQDETEAETMAIDCVKRPEGCITPIENEVEGPSLSDTPQTPDSAERDTDGAVPVVVEK